MMNPWTATVIAIGVLITFVACALLGLVWMAGRAIRELEDDDDAR